jgi:small basic protein (TIGR04137 family)
MSLHRSLKVAASLVRSRNVLKRGERLEKLEEQGRWDEEKDSIYGLPKTRIQVAKKIGKKKKKKKDEDEGDKKKKKK